MSTISTPLKLPIIYLLVTVSNFEDTKVKDMEYFLNYLKNCWNNTRLVCTQLSEFFMLNTFFSGLWEFRLKSEFKFFFLISDFFGTFVYTISIGDFKISDFLCHFQTFFFISSHSHPCFIVFVFCFFENNLGLNLTWCTQHQHWEG